MRSKAISLVHETFRAQSKELPKTASLLEKEFRKLRGSTAFGRSQLASDFIINWLYAYREFQTNLNAQFNRKVRHPSADEFTAAIAFTLEQYLRSKGIRGWVHSEIGLPLIPRLRYDIVVKSPEADVPIAVIECKTQLGWNRAGWHNEQIEREKLVLRKYPDVVFGLCVHRRSNWRGTWSLFDKAAKGGKPWYCLLEDDPDTLEKCTALRHKDIEPLFIQIGEKCIWANKTGVR